MQRYNLDFGGGVCRSASIMIARDVDHQKACWPLYPARSASQSTFIGFQPSSEESLPDMINQQIRHFNKSNLMFTRTVGSRFALQRRFPLLVGFVSLHERTEGLPLRYKRLISGVDRAHSIYIPIR